MLDESFLSYLFSCSALGPKRSFGFKDEPKSCLRKAISKTAKVTFIGWAARNGFPAVTPLDQPSQQDVKKKINAEKNAPKKKSQTSASLSLITFITIGLKSYSPNISPCGTICTGQLRFVFKEGKKMWPLWCCICRINTVALNENNNTQEFSYLFGHSKLIIWFEV